jgi:hypothetical protein
MGFEFIRRPRRRPYADRIRDVLELVNKKGSLTTTEFFQQYPLEPYYIRKLFQMAAAKHSFLIFDAENDVLYIKQPDRETKRLTEVISAEKEAES